MIKAIYIKIESKVVTSVHLSNFQTNELFAINIIKRKESSRVQSWIIDVALNVSDIKDVADVADVFETSSTKSFDRITTGDIKHKRILS